MRVVHLASEVAPFCKTGGLGDVVGALPAALASTGPGVEVATFLPLHRSVRGWLGTRDAGVSDTGTRVAVPLAGGRTLVRFLELTDPSLAPTGGGRTFFADAPSLFDRPGLYGHADDALRYGAFSRAVLMAATPLLGGPPDLVHAHDWHTALASVYLEARRPPELGATRSLLTIHNLAYQGVFAPEVLPRIDLDGGLMRFDILEFFGAASFLKGGITACDAVSTVSPSYAREILTPEFGCNLDAHLRAHAGKLAGILNGLDVAEWDPATQPALPTPFSAAEPTGKAACRSSVLAEMGAQAAPDSPVFGVVSRFTAQKGLDLVCDVAPSLLRRGARLLVLGTGEGALEGRFAALAARFPGRVAVRLGFDAGLAHRIVAGSDLFLVPSRFEPCGLTQLQAMRYGAVPVVHAVGGLRDTVADTGDERLLAGDGQGFRFEHPTAPGLLWAADRAIAAWRRDPAGWARLVRAIMEQDVSWAGPARAYLGLYERVLARG